jgi:hypothetical protein
VGYAGLYGAVPEVAKIAAGLPRDARRDPDEASRHEAPRSPADLGQAHGDLRPPEALRRAQLWLPDLTDPELAAFLSAYPSHEAEFRRRAAAGDRPGRRTATRRGSTEEQRPFSGPDYWAPSIALGA